MTTIDELVAHKKNPRYITKKEYELLDESLVNLGDLGIIVFNVRNKSLVGGHQRMEVIKHMSPNLVVTEDFDEPDAQGTVCLGNIVVTKEGKTYSYAYREVDWDNKTHDRAMIQANKLGGKFDFDGLANNFEVEDLLEWGFEEHELGFSAGASDEMINEGKEMSFDDFDNGGVIKLEFTNDDYLDVIERINKIRMSGESDEAIFFRLLNVYEQNA